jgi:uncharacterized membrane protein YdbT with pleckstrin-like domain
MYKAFCNFCERLLRIPPAPEPPPGDEHTTQIFRAAPNFLKYLLFIWAAKSVVIVFALGFGLLAIAIPTFFAHGHGRAHFGAIGYIIALIEVIVLALAVLSRVFSLALVHLDFEKRWYVVTDRSLRVREGIVNIREMTVNFANIQNISISQGPIQRMLQIADLKVDTAGGGSVQPRGQHQMYSLHTAFFRGVSNANEIRELIQTRLRHLKDSGLGDHEEVAASAKVTMSEEGIIAALREVHDEARRLNSALQMS